jgi:hypothetical protein
MAGTFSQMYIQVNNNLGITFIGIIFTTICVPFYFR